MGGGQLIPDTCMDTPGCSDVYYDQAGVAVAEVRSTARCTRARTRQALTLTVEAADFGQVPVIADQLQFSCAASRGLGEGAALLSKDALCFALCDPTTAA